MSSAWPRLEVRTSSIADCAGGLAAAQYRVKLWPLMRNDRCPVGSTRKMTSGPAAPSPPKVGWTQVKRVQTRSRPRRDPRPSPPHVTVARSTRTRRPSTRIVSPAMRSRTFSWPHAGGAFRGRCCDVPLVAWPEDASPPRPTLCVSEVLPPHAPPATATARSGSAMAAVRRERTRIACGFPDGRTVHAEAEGPESRDERRRRAQPRGRER
jgi:hypothetical protein